jgi:hypothetical protein
MSQYSSRVRNSTFNKKRAEAEMLKVEKEMKEKCDKNDEEL